MASDVKIIIEMSKPIGNEGFGYPLILVEHATADKAYKTYASLEAVSTDYAATTDAYKVASLMFEQAHFPTKIAICSTQGAAETWLDNDANASKDWRQLVVLCADDEETTNVATIMTKIEGLKYPKFYFANVDSDCSTNFKSSECSRTLVCFYTATADIPSPVAAIAAEVAGLEVGSYTINNLVINGITPLDISETAIKAVHDKGGVTFVIAADDCVVSEGKAADGTYVDVIDGNDYISQRLEYATQKVFNDNLKVPYNNVGIALLESAASTVMTEAMNMGIVDDYTVAYALREQCSDADIANRKYVGGNITYTMAGAIHEATIYCLCTL